ncbi:MAG: hypothetical protein KAW61_03105 [candidate division Zixibacteria bacterium]|jgi:hypothetical protein|nr:hypothetical protein [candidate division Zixibacteria bacterium]
MAKKMSFSDKANKRAHTQTCPVCQEPIQHVKFMKAVKSDKGGWKMRAQNVGVCKCNNAEIYG